MVSLNLPPFTPKVIEKEGKPMIFDQIRRKYVALTPEEWVRQHFVHFLMAEKNYPKELLANEVTLKLNRTTKRCDTVAYSSDLTPLVLVEYKSPDVTITQDVFDQIARYNRVLRVDYLIVSNGMQHFCCKLNYSNNEYAYLQEIPTYEEIQNKSIG